MVKNYIPKKGDIVLLNFSPRKGHEQSGKRPALVISPFAYNQKVGLALFCPITSRSKNYPFEVRLPGSLKTEGVVLSDQVNSLDWKSRRLKYFEKLPVKQLDEVIGKVNALINV